MEEIYRAPKVEVAEEHEPVRTDRPLVTADKEERPLATGKPILEIMEIGESKDHFEMPSLIKEIDSFIKSEIERQKMKSNEESYREILDTYLKKIPDSDIYAKVEHLADLIRVDRKLVEAMREKEEIMTKDITQLTSKQLERRINDEANKSTNN